MNINFTVNNEILKRADKYTIVEKTFKYLYATFEFSDEWHDMPKTAVFTHDDLIAEVVIEDDQCEIPYYLIRATGFSVSVYSGNRLITNSVDIQVYTQSPDELPKPTESVYEQLVTINYEHECRISALELGLIPTQGTIYMLTVSEDGTAPDRAVEGDFYYDSGVNRIFRYTANRWLDSKVVFRGSRLYVALDTGVVYYYNGTRLVEVLGGGGTPTPQPSKFIYTIVGELPTVGEEGIIYLLRKTTSGNNKYEEYIWVNEAWECLGSLDIDLSNYITKNMLTSNPNMTNPSSELIPTESGLAKINQAIRTYVAQYYVSVDGDQTLSGKKISASDNDISNLDMRNFDGSTFAEEISTTHPSQSKLPTEKAVMDLIEDERLVAGDNITIQKNPYTGKKVISGTPVEYRAGTNIEIDQTNRVISARGLNYTTSSSYLTIDNNSHTIDTKNIPAYLNDLKDLDISSLQNNQTIVYQDGKWVNKAPTEVGFYSATGYVHISDDNVISVDLSDRERKLTPQSTIRIWDYYGTHYIATNMYINDILNVSTDNPINGQILLFNGTNWVNAELPEGKPYIAGEGISIVADGDSFIVSLSQATKSRLNEIDRKEDRLTAGDNITIENKNGQHIISAFADLDADDVNYLGQGSKYPTVKDALDSLLYKPMSYTALTINPSYAEMGQVVNDVTCSWGITETDSSKLASQNIVLNGSQTVPIATNLFRYTFTSLGITQSYTFQLNLRDTAGHDYSPNVVTFSFRRANYWGATSKETLTNADVLALTGKNLVSSASGVGGTYTFDCVGGQYCYFVLPTRYASTVKVLDASSGLPVTAFSQTTMDVTNAYNYTENYTILRSDYKYSVQTKFKLQV